MTSKSTSLPSSIEGVSGKHAVSELWKSHFGRLLNVIQDDGLCDISCDTTYSDDIHVSTNEVVLAVQALCAQRRSQDFCLGGGHFSMISAGRPRFSGGG